MIRFLRSLVDWLERRFPEKIVMTLDEVNQMKNALQKIEEHEARLKTLEIMTGFGVNAVKGKEEMLTR